MKPTLHDLLDRLRNLPPTMGFDMANSAQSHHETSHPCGSACCIGGHAAFMLQAPHLTPIAAMMGLGVPQDEADRLCYPNHAFDAWDATLPQAIRVVEILIETGRVDWEGALLQ